MVKKHIFLHIMWAQRRLQLQVLHGFRSLLIQGYSRFSKDIVSSNAFCNIRRLMKLELVHARYFSASQQPQAEGDVSSPVAVGRDVEHAAPLYTSSASSPVPLPRAVPSSSIITYARRARRPSSRVYSSQEIDEDLCSVESFSQVQHIRELLVGLAAVRSTLV